MKATLRFLGIALGVAAVIVIIRSWPFNYSKKENKTSLARPQMPVTNHQAQIEATNSSPQLASTIISAEKPHSLLFSSPNPPPANRATNQFFGPEELRAYAEQHLLTLANRANQAFGYSSGILSLSNGIYRVKCYEGGLDGIFALRDGRYFVTTVHSQIEIYADEWFRQQVFRDPMRLEALSNEKNYLTSESARFLAEQALKTLGVDETTLASLGDPVVKQQTWKERQDKPLPVYVVTWLKPRKPDEQLGYFFRFDIMGIVPGGSVSEFRNATFGDEKYLQTPLPTDYREKVRAYLEKGNK